MKFQGKELPLIITLAVVGVACIVLLVLTITFAHQNNRNDEDTAPMKIVRIQDFEDHAERTMDTNQWLYVKTGATTQTTTRANPEVYQNYRFRPKLLVDVSKVETWVDVLNKALPMPIGFSPTAYQKWMSPNGDIEAARAASNKKALLVLSAHATTRMEEVAESTVGNEGRLWQQTYLFRKRDITLDFVKRMERTGKIEAVVVTVDRPWSSINYNSLRGKQSPPAEVSTPVNFPGIPLTDLVNPAQTWDEVKWLVNQTKLPVILKGILRAEDAVKAAECGAAGVFVSNHGGRVLDGVPATLDALNEVVVALNNTRVEVYFDGGIRTGMDAVKAMILGARAVFVGRPLMWGLHHSGQQGAEKVLEILGDEFYNTLQLMGAPSPRDLTPDMLIKADSSTDVARSRTEL